MRPIAVQPQVFETAQASGAAGRRASLWLDGMKGKKESSRQKELRRGLGMCGFQAIVADRARGGGAGVDDGSPALQTMVVVVMEQIGNANG